MAMSRLRSVGRSLFSTVASKVKPVTVRTLRAQYERSELISMVTCYDYPSACHVDASGVDVALVGDSLGMVVQGNPDTTSVTLEEVEYHCRMVRRGIRRALVVADLPFGSYEYSGECAARAAVSLVKNSGVDAVKLEGDRPHLVRAVRNTGVAVMGHVGLTPQAISSLGGFRPVGRNYAEAKAVLDGAIRVQEAGAFAIVLECVPSAVAGQVRKVLNIPTIGIGSGTECDGQVLVYHDLVGMANNYSPPKFAKRYANVGTTVENALKEFRKDVTDGTFPASNSATYKIEDDDSVRFEVYAESLEERKMDSEKQSEESEDRPNSQHEEDNSFKLY